MWLSILDCLLFLEDVNPSAFVDVVFAGETFTVGEKLIFVWRLGALVRLRAIVARMYTGECEPSRELFLLDAVAHWSR